MDFNELGHAQLHRVVAEVFFIATESQVVLCVAVLYADELSSEISYFSFCLV